ncbi:hypothetical protein HJFPF1_06378 [Paramyrothecium foliicola]|nr:hypothetical protein HJFPF1_06378 [Paramyrothecium foliicola]
MSSSTLKSGPPAKVAQGGAAQNTQNLLLGRVNARTSTPDSEALASSDDEGDHRQGTIQPIVPPKPVRRSSWLNDTSQPIARPRKGSFASSSMSPTGSNPSTPSVETAAGVWGAHTSTSVAGRTPGTATFPWGTGIWNSDRKDPPSRLTEVLPSPTSAAPPGASSNSFFGPDSGLTQTSPNSRDPAPNSQIPFAIPLHPTPKTYRSQSYSAGQLDNDVNPLVGMSSSAVLGRARHPALQHRPSRPSMLSEMSNDGSILGKVKEVDDDDEDENVSESLQSSIHQSSEAKTIELLARENAMLRQQQQQQQQQFNARLRPRASTSTSFLNNGYSMQETVPEESDFAIDELDELADGNDMLGRRATNRRMSEYGAPPLRNAVGLESRKTDNTNLKKALWSSSLGFSMGDISQSRRHSFANMPTRQGSISSLADSTAALEAASGDGQSSHEYPNNLVESPGFTTTNTVASNYFTGPGNLGNPLPPAFNNPYQSPFGMQNPFQNRAPSPHRNVYSMAQPRHNQLLHVVLFKCARADVFYIQEGTGLTVKPGDLVIVEADRGTDLGTVAKESVDWQTAKELKEHYAEEQYKWLMMYSQGASATQDGPGPGLLASSAGLQGSAVGGMGPPSQHHMQEPNAGELRPKLIKRLAQNHEIHSLREKEGQEAKAKRVCMQKVKEHGLNMEILDAEFQMDWKKLTFYYFADSYINFNSLVTDLFKIYKTRIWMSAINPASFASPTLGIQAPSGIGPGAVGVGRAGGGNDRRQNHQQQQQEQQPQSFAVGSQAGRGFRPTYNQAFGGDRIVPPATGYPPSHYGYAQAGTFGNARNNAYIPGVAPNVDTTGFANLGYQQPADFQSTGLCFIVKDFPFAHATNATGKNTRAVKSSTEVKGTRAKVDEPGYGDQGNSSHFVESETRSKKPRTSIMAARVEIQNKLEELALSIENQSQLSYVQDIDSIHSIPLEQTALRANTDPLRMRVAKRGSHNKALVQPSLAVQHFKGTIKEYEVGSKRHSIMEQPRWMRWEQDKKDLGSLNQEILGIAARSIHENIMSATNGSAVGLSDHGNSMERMAHEMLEEALPKRPSDTWGMAAKEMLQAAAGFLKLQPEGNSSH